MNIISLIISVDARPLDLLVRGIPVKKRYYVQLADKAGAPLLHGGIIGGFESLDWVVLNAAQLYADLLLKLQVNQTHTKKE